MPKKLKVQHNGAEIEIDLPEGTLSADEVSESYMRKTVFQTELDRRLAKLSEGMAKRDDLLVDEEFLQTMLEKQGKELFDPEKAKKGKQQTGESMAAELARAEQEWTKKNLEPAQLKATKAESLVGSLRQKILHGMILQAGIDGGVKKIFLTPPDSNGIPPLVSFVENMFAFDPTLDEFFVRGDEEGSFAFSSKPDEGHPYKNVAEFMGGWLGKKENLDFLDKEKQKGPGLQSVVGELSGKDVVLTQAQASDHATYKQAQETASKQGGRVITQAPMNHLGGYPGVQ